MAQELAKERLEKCPKCGDEEIYAGDFEWGQEEGWVEIECGKCQFKWFDVYKFSHLENKDGYPMDKDGDAIYPPEQKGDE